MNTLQPERSSQEITLSRRIGFLVFPDCEILDVGGPFEAFHFANHWLQRFGRTNEPSYQLRILAATPGPIRTMSGIRDRRNPQLLRHNGRAGYFDRRGRHRRRTGLQGRGARRMGAFNSAAGAARGVDLHRRVHTGGGRPLESSACDDALDVFRTPRQGVSISSGGFESPFRSRREYLLFGRDHRGDRSGLSLSRRRPGPGNHARCRPHYGGFSPTPRRAIPVQRVFEWFGTEEPARHR